VVGTLEPGGGSLSPFRVRVVLPRLPRSRQQALAMAHYWAAFALLNFGDEAAMLALMFC